MSEKSSQSDIDVLYSAISIACWIVVFSPQIIENFRKSSADALSVQFVIIWLLGDIFNILGAVLQGVLPTMVTLLHPFPESIELLTIRKLILAVYYTLADIVLLGQCFYYRGFTWKDEIPTPERHVGEPTEQTGLLPPGATSERRASNWSDVSVSHLSPAVPLHEAIKPDDLPAIRNQKPTTALQTALFNTTAILLVFAAGFGGWYISNRSRQRPNHHVKSAEDEISFNVLGQVFGYLCAVFYLGSRVPQILHNYRRKSTEGVSMLFFLFACFGNLTYVLSIFAYEPICHGKHGRCRSGESGAIYLRYITVNASWIIGSLGTLFLDLAIFIQFFIYRETEEDREHARRAERANRPLLERGDSEYAVGS
jgi:uncharacterized protein with PQ loop repeat